MLNNFLQEAIEELQGYPVKFATINQLSGLYIVRLYNLVAIRTKNRFCSFFGCESFVPIHCTPQPPHERKGRTARGQRMGRGDCSNTEQRLITPPLRASLDSIEYWQPAANHRVRFLDGAKQLFSALFPPIAKTYSDLKI